MGSSKLISNRELFHIVLLLHQGSVFWILPYFIVKGNGTAGMTTLLPGLLAGVLILVVCSFWGRRCRERGFVEALPQLLGKPLGTLLALCLLAFYMSFTIICLCSFVEMLNGQLFVETPRFVLLCTIFLLVGWLSWNGLEDIARLAVLCTAAAVGMLLLAAAGNADSFALEHMLPLELKAPQQLQMSMLHSIYSYSGLLALFMIYPALNTEKKINRQLLFSLLLSTGMVAAWMILSLGVFGQSGLGKAVWLPLELARMVQMGPFLERTEAMFAVLWMVVVFINGSLLLWSVSQGLHQLLGRKKQIWLHWGVVLLLLCFSAAIKDVLQLFQLEQALSVVNIGMLPMVLLMVTVGTMFYVRRKRRRGDHEAA